MKVLLYSLNLRRVNSSLDNVVCLYDTVADPGTSEITITLNKSISDYRYLYVIGSKAFNSSAKYIACIPVNILKLADSYYGSSFGNGENGIHGILIKYVSDTSLNVIRAASGKSSFIDAIYGTK